MKDPFNLLCDSAQKQDRLNICFECELKTMKLGEALCTECNCFLKAKTMLKKTKCPLGKW